MLVIDDFCRDTGLLERIAGDATFFEPGYHWWSGWWSPHHNAQRMTPRLELIEYIWRFHTPDGFRGRRVTGFEHWAGTYDGADASHKVDHSEHGVRGHPIFSLIPHMDKDEYHWRQTGEVVGPAIGTVFYPVDHQCEGGYLRIYETHEVDFTAPYELIAPRFNRLVIFDATRLHAVEEVTQGVRKAIAINLWDRPLSAGQMADMCEVR